MKCRWKQCNGIINPETGLCMMCARSIDIEFEKEIERKKSAVKTYAHSTARDYYMKANKKRKKYG